MNFGNKPQSLQSLLKDYLKKSPHKKELRKGMVMHLWPQIVGDKIAKATIKLKFEGEKLVVYMESEAWRHELHMNRYSIMKKLNDRIEFNLIKEIIVKS